ncbi:CoA transferase [Sphingomonas sp. HF-S4]|uniref:CoA transferase n=1 Tax=Sphingomonas agrestis TaxID=3080540 RepID=A0ABU3Y7D2_9SPHN|nr:CoA transferase [Sphingomonas sp. HF-S4]MDV3457088.1 CoA transferase [Sphingomonas sp. HF-S4]
MSKPLDGILVADFSHVMAGPYASHLLGLMGAEVIKIESVEGDAFRSYGADERLGGMSPAFIAANAGKKSIALDLKDPSDRDIARRIVDRADVLLENFRPGVIERLGFAYAQVCQSNPDIVFCSVSGYGQDGPYRDWPAIDNIVQATSGMMMLSGGDGDPPMRVGFPIVDTLTGQTAAIAILSALFRRANGGGGSFIDVSMLDASLAFMTSALTPFLATGTPMPRSGNTGYSGLPTAAMFTARDGREISLGVVQPKQFAALARHLGREDWLDDPRFATGAAQRENFDAFHDEVAREILRRDAVEWERGMSAEGIPCGMVRRVDEAIDLARPGAMIPVALSPDGHANRVDIPGPGFRLSPDIGSAGGPPPRLDQHRQEILDWLDTPA